MRKPCYEVKGAVNDTFDGLALNGTVPDWNLYAPQWAPVTVVNTPQKAGKCLELADKDPYDYARAIRVFEEGSQIACSVSVSPAQQQTGMLDIDLTDRYGNRPVRLRFDDKGHIVVTDGGTEKIVQPYEAGTWYTISLTVHAQLSGGWFDVIINGKKVVEHAALAEAVKSVERLSLRTGPYRDLPNRKTPNEDPHPPLAGADEPVTRAVFYVDDVVIRKQ